MVGEIVGEVWFKNGILVDPLWVAFAVVVRAVVGPRLVEGFIVVKPGCSAGDGVAVSGLVAFGFV